MPFPLSKVQFLSDYEGSFVLSVHCCACQHERPLSARTLAVKAGSGAAVSSVVRRLRCSACNSRRVDVMVVGIPR
jgi:hypothetical protein